VGKHTELGKNGEIIALDFLKNKGHKIIATNYRCGHKEIDLISFEKDELVFCEIKTRSNFHFGYPEEAVTLRKQALLKEAAAAFLLEHQEYSKIRFDIISILMKGNTVQEILHFEDAFY
jgi:putative endonuclease